MGLIANQIVTVGLASATSANGTVRNGASLSMSQVDPLTLSFECVGSITTSSVQATYKVQASPDGTNWDTLFYGTEPLVATVSTPGGTTAAGTGSPVAHRLALVLPPAVSAYQFVRATAVLAGAATAGADVTAVTYRYCRVGTLVG
jgi:hypothetical protein